MKGYALQTNMEITSAMEDYLEMIARINKGGADVRVSDLSRQLHVKAPSVTKMVQQLARTGLVYAEKYGDIILTENGSKLGNYLLYRHDVLQTFLCLLNHSENELEQVEKIEHFLDERTIKNLELLNQYLKRL
ncbi:MAG TPA: iron dependent repressor, metal binding and dimerization domain protein [Lachnospiraceae bacterium]|nr:iron dependent repressor, metal binding and dimerization domain protein [Lachnospiraceae bacterium]